MLTFIIEGNDKFQIEIIRNKEPRLEVLRWYNLKWHVLAFTFSKVPKASIQCSSMLLPPTERHCNKCSTFREVLIQEPLVLGREDHNIN